MPLSPLVSVIIPVYNSEKYLRTCIDSVLGGLIAPEKLEVIAVDDGSTDNSAAILNEIASSDSRLRIFTQANGGQSRARNLAMQNARGKYLFFLDSDDTVSPETIENVCAFFEEHFDETDLVTYPLVKVDSRGVRSKPHARYDIMNKTAVYHLNEGQNMFIAHSSMNVCVKNRFEENPLFDECPWQEDMKFCIGTVLPKMTVGFCAEAEYLYLYHASSTVATKFYSYYIFEKTLGFFEELFARFEVVPPAVQGYYLNDYAWKSGMDILLPYHYGAEEFARAKARLDALSARLSPETVAAAPYLSDSEKCFFLRRCCGELTIGKSDDGYAVFGSGVKCVQAQALAEISRLKIKNGRLGVYGFTKTPLVLAKDFALVVCCGSAEKVCDLSYSHNTPVFGDEAGFNYYEFSAHFELSTAQSLEVFAVFGGEMLPCRLDFSDCCALNSTRNSAVVGSFVIKKAGEKKLHISDPGTLVRLAARLNIEKIYFTKYKKAFLLRQLVHLRPHGRVWLYSDRDGFSDNAAIQFKADFERRDGVKRYYIANRFKNAEKIFSAEQMKNVVEFGSVKHIRLWYAAEKLLTAFVEKDVCTPFGAGPLRHYADLPMPEIIYLQHGVMHAALEKIYSREICWADRVVVSTAFEKAKLCERYNYSPSQLLKSGMPSLDLVGGGKPQRKILLAPSWRRNLIGRYQGGSREPSPEAFLNSVFFKELQAFLLSPQLAELLEKNDMTLDFKNHPIFEVYNSLFKIDNSRIRIVSGDCRLSDYALLITDFSSIMFNFIYMCRPIISFVPDYEMFLAGVTHTYRKLDLPLGEGGFTAFTSDCSSLLASLAAGAENGFTLDAAQREAAEKLFLTHSGHCDALYNALTEK